MKLRCAGPLSNFGFKFNPRRYGEGLVDMMRECKLFTSAADASTAMAAVRRGDQDFADPCEGVG